VSAFRKHTPINHRETVPPNRTLHQQSHRCFSPHGSNRHPHPPSLPLYLSRNGTTDKTEPLPSPKRRPRKTHVTANGVVGRRTVQERPNVGRLRVKINVHPLRSRPTNAHARLPRRVWCPVSRRTLRPSIPPPLRRSDGWSAAAPLFGRPCDGPLIPISSSNAVHSRSWTGVRRPGTMPIISRRLGPLSERAGSLLRAERRRVTSPEGVREGVRRGGEEFDIAGRQRHRSVGKHRTSGHLPDTATADCRRR